MVAQIDLTTASQLFDTEVTLKFQNHEYLRDTIEERHGTTGLITNIPVSDIIEMSQGNFAPTDIPITSVNRTNITVTAQDFRVKTTIGGGQKTLFAYDQIVDEAKIHAKAAGRLLDFIKINTIFTHPSFSSIVQIPVATGLNTGINAIKISKGLNYLESQGVDVMNYSCSLWAPALVKDSMVGDDRIVNFFYVNDKPLPNNVFQSYLGTNLRFLGENGVNKIPSTPIGGGVNQYLVPLVNKEAMVQTFNRDVQTSITWVPNQDRYELLTIVTTNANIVQLNGIVLLVANTPFVNN